MLSNASLLLIADSKISLYNMDSAFGLWLIERLGNSLVILYDAVSENK